jgi:hypothetical protein
MMSSGMLRRVALVRIDVSEEPNASIRVTRIGELGTTLAATSNRQRASVARRCTSNRSTLRRNVVPSSPIPVTLKMEAIRSFETSVLAGATDRLCGLVVSGPGC